jgi:hypothetical protein
LTYFLERICVVISSFRPLVRFAGSALAVAVFGFAAAVLYVEAARLPSATPLDAQDDPLQNTGMFVRRDRPVTPNGPHGLEGRDRQTESVNILDWTYTGRPIPSTFRIF